MLEETWSNRRFFRRPSFALIMIALISFSITGQRNSHNEALLLETGKATALVAPATGNELKIVSYNIRWRGGAELEKIIQWLKSTKDSGSAAIIGLQEVDRAKKRSGSINHAKALAESLGMYYAWAAPPEAKAEKPKEEETGVELLSRYPLNDVTRIILPNPGPGGRLRVALAATIKIAETNVRIYSVHSETRLPMSQKVDQLRAVLDDLARFPKDTPAIVVGDFNSWELPAIAGVRKLFTTAGFTTALPDDESTFQRKAVFFDMKLKLDWIWVRGFAPQSYGIDRSMTVSDHFPIWTVVKLPEPNPAAGSTR